MKNLSLKICLVIAALASPVWSETINDFVERNGKYYLKFTDEGFSGKVEGRVQGTLKDGLWEGKYTSYWNNGQLEQKGNYGDGKKGGIWTVFKKNGTPERTEIYKNGVRVE